MRALLGAMPIILRARLARAHDWESNPALNAAFEALPGLSFTVNGAAIPHDAALIAFLRSLSTGRSDSRPLRQALGSDCHSMTSAFGSGRPLVSPHRVPSRSSAVDGSRISAALCVKRSAQSRWPSLRAL
jgi:hypothetical protein